MAVETARVVRRTVDDELDDKQQAFQNYQKETWRSWPNKGAVSHLLLSVPLVD